MRGSTKPRPGRPRRRCGSGASRTTCRFPTLRPRKSPKFATRSPIRRPSRPSIAVTTNRRRMEGKRLHHPGMGSHRRPGLRGGAQLHSVSGTPLAVLLLCFLASLPQELLMAQTSAPAAPQPQVLTAAQLNDSMRKLQTELVAKYGEGQKARVLVGLHQVVEFWRPEDGDAAAFESFVRVQRLLEQLDGHMHEIAREFAAQQDLDLGPIRPYDEIFAGYDPSAHVLDDFFQNKLAFVVLLNFPLTSLEERLNLGPKWTRRQWAETRLAERFSKRIP